MAGLAGRVRACQDSDEFDLSGYSREQCAQLAKAAFEEPVELAKMVRISFVVGGGKLCRQKYSDNLPKDICSALDAIGYDDDKAAACELECAGRYKFQHDTSKNLKFVHVFPRVLPPAATGGDEEGAEEASGGSRGPADVLAACEMDEFRRLVTTHVVSYSQLRRLLDELRARLSKLDAAEQKLIARQSLDASEQALYDSLSAETLREKVKLVTTNLQAAVESCQLTAADCKEVLEQLEAKQKLVDTEIKKAEADKKEKLLQKLEEQKEKLKATRAAVAGASPKQTPPLKHGENVRKMRLKLAQIAKMEKDSAGHYTLDELKRLGERPEIEEALKVFEERSRLWFETDEEFELRLARNLREGAVQKKSGGGGSGGGYGGGAGSKDGFSTVGKKR